MLHVRIGASPSSPGAFALLALLVVGALSPLVPTAVAQEAPFLCFEGEDPNGVVVPNSSCEVGLYDSANYQQGEPVLIKVQNAPGQNPLVRVRCATNCHEVAGKSYYATWRGQSLAFPAAFTEAGRGDGADAPRDRVPRYNSSWTATVLLPGERESSRTFNVWLLDAYKGENMSVQPGASHRIRSAGHDPNAPVVVEVERRNANGVFVDAIAPREERASVRGEVLVDYAIPPTRSGEIGECGTRLHDCYRVLVRGGGKENESIPFRVSYATIRIRDLQEQNAASAGLHDGTVQTQTVLERTQKVTLEYALNYPRGRVLEGPKLLEEDLPEPPANRPRGLRVVVESYDPSDGRTKERLDDVYMRFVDSRFRWAVSWTAPVDLALEDTVQGPQLDVRLRLVEQSDKYGNRVPGRILANYTVKPAVLDVALESSPTDLPRTAEGAFRFAIKYHNGSILGEAEADAPLRGCFVRDADPAPSCPFGRPLVDATYEDERWVMRVRYPRDYAFVDAEGDHLLVLPQEMEDKWGNRVNEVDEGPRRFGPFTVVPYKPNVNFSTVSRGEDAHTLVRGHRVAVQAVVTYGDGRPFNHTVAVDKAAYLDATLTRRGPGGAIQSQELFRLHQTDQEAGRFIGYLDLPRDDTAAPAGTWTFAFDVADNLTAPNANRTHFNRTVAAALIKVSPLFQPPPTAPTGSTVRFRFRLLYDDDRPVSPDAITGQLVARVHRYDAEKKVALDGPIGGELAPLWRGDEYVLEYPVPPSLFAGSYVFVLSGGDQFGNHLGDDAVSRPFQTFAPTRVREVLAQPPESITRGDSATVIFDGSEGDMGLPGWGVPAIRLERYDPNSDAWLIERQTLRISEPSTSDHIAVLSVATTTVIGLYRFRLEGRDATYNLVHAVSENFTVEPTTVTRALVQPPPEVVAKGDTIQLSFERQHGDRILRIDTLYNGRAVDLQPPTADAEGRVFNVTFAVPFDAPAGNYSVRLTGLDLFGNRLEVVSPLVDVTPTELRGKIIGNPPRVVERGERATIVFGITNPDGGFYLAVDPPAVTVHNGTSVVAEATVKRTGLTFEATWTPPEDAEETEYVFEVSGTGVGGNQFPTLRSATFRVAPGTVTREVISSIPSESLRMSTITMTVPFSPSDRRVEFTLGYYGAASQASAALFETRSPTTAALLPHTLDPATGQYVARFVTDHQTPTGAYRIFMKGEDELGNELVARSNVFLLRPTTILVQWDSAQQADALADGKTIELTFTARYRNGPALTEDLGRPTVALFWIDPVAGTPRRISEPAPELTSRGERWTIRWTAPEVLADGQWYFNVAGADNAGNAIASQQSTMFVVSHDTGESVLTALKQVPSPSLGLVLVLLVGIAVAGRRRD